MSKFKKTLLCGIAPLLLASMLGLTTQAVASDERLYGRFTKDNELYTPRNYREWVFIGSSVTPNDMNDGAAAFPEFHNVYIDPGSFAHWKKTGEFRNNTVIVKELVGIRGKESPSGNGYFPGEFNGIAAMVKSEKRYPNRPGNWAYFGFDGESRHGAIQEDSACSACHQQHAEQDQVFTQGYPVLRAAKP
ncbi:Cytochrome P460 [Nitrosomonas aestuarii]|uniref:Cytochrome P460 n=1 Tax=Nitrosomonas aestuarii TaxID=52441 RepID=A0A1I4FWW7_9PROT|nr:cytochrome P460 family protein [Nitrosomonas aestuarii]SFL21700.1 Cytochrome P460 [Nitrosomonas aestuarii]